MRFHLLFDAPVELDLAHLAARLAEFDPALVDAVIELDLETRIARVAFGAFEMWFRAVGDPMPEAALEPAVQLAHLDPDEKAAARAHRCFVILEHAPPTDRSPRPLDRYRALAIVAAAFAGLGARFIVNLEARTVVPAAALIAPPTEVIQLVERLSPLLFYMGFAKYEVALPPEREGDPVRREGVWMRTHGAAAFGLPDLARLASGHEEGLATFGAMSEMFVHMIESGAALAVGDVVQLPEGALAILRPPHRDEAFVAVDDGPVLVLEPTSFAA